MKYKERTVDTAAWAKETLETIRREFDGEGKLMPPRVYILATRDPKMGLRLPRPATIVMLPTDFASKDEKGAFAVGIQAVVRKSQAVGYLFASEVWLARPTSEREAREAHEVAARGGLWAWPNRHEAVVATYQPTGTSTTTIWAAPIVREPNQRPRLAEFHEQDAYGETFAGLMPEVS